ncbi:MAG: citrate synthase [Paraglaciecola psychrophila]|jgi:citrate synthase
MSTLDSGKDGNQKLSAQWESMDLAGVVVGETAISDVDGIAGTLSYRGRSIESLASQPFLSVVELLLHGGIDESGARHQALSASIREQRHLSAVELALVTALPTDLHPMLALQALVPTLSTTPFDGPGPDPLCGAGVGDGAIDGQVLRQGLCIAAKLPTIIAARHRLAQGLSVVPSSEALGLHENFLLMYHGAVPSSDKIRILDTVQILQMEHSFNAGTFAGRVCASTQAPIASSIAASIGTLFGVLHGGADQAALEMAMAVGSVDRAEAFVAECLKNKGKIMGMGHREYKVLDPRAAILKPMAQSLCGDGESRTLLEILVAVEQACQRAFAANGKDIRANVEFYKGAVFHSLGIERLDFTALFAMARVYGYIAHYLEFAQCSRLIRPRARYVGPSLVQS